MSDTSAAIAPASTSTQTASQTTSDPSEVGWQFVPQYYTFINKQPDRLHCFYKKHSTFIHGTEGEDGQPCHGQHEIHEKIMSMGLENCKVFIHSVDAQASTANGIIIQVIGEMSNRGEDWRKFVQTFFLAEQPKGYYILNDIFRFLKEESIQDDEAIEGEGVEDAVPAKAEEEVDVVTEAPHPEPASTTPTETKEVAEEPVREPTPAPAPEAAPEEPPITKPEPNGIHEKEEPTEEVTEPAAEAPTAESAAEEPVPSTPAKASPAPAPAQAAQPASEKAKAPAQAPPQRPAEPEKPAGPRTWASLAASNPNRWSSNLATESRGTSVEAAPAPATTAPSRSSNQTPVSTPPQTGGQHQHQHQQQGHTAPRNVREVAASLTRGDVFVKGLVDPITNQDLENMLSKFGKIKSKEFVRNRAIAFFEFEEVESARNAIIESGNVGNGGGGGIFYRQNGQNVRVIVDVKREKGDKERPPARPRQGGIPNQPNSDRGGFRGGRGGARGRGIAAGK